jgi:hypothetical protein
MELKVDREGAPGGALVGMRVIWSSGDLVIADTSKTRKRSPAHTHTVRLGRSGRDHLITGSPDHLHQSVNTNPRCLTKRVHAVTKCRS